MKLWMLMPAFWQLNISSRFSDIVTLSHKGIKPCSLSNKACSKSWKNFRYFFIDTCFVKLLYWGALLNTCAFTCTHVLIRHCGILLFFMICMHMFFRAVLGIVNRVFKDFVKDLFKRLLSLKNVLKDYVGK